MKHLVTLSALLLSACSTILTPGGVCTVSPADQSAWNQATKTNTAKSYQAYLKKFPNGCYASKANKHLRKPAPAVALTPVANGGNHDSGRSNGGNGGNGGSAGRSSGY